MIDTDIGLVFLRKGGVTSYRACWSVPNVGMLIVGAPMMRAMNIPRQRFERVCWNKEVRMDQMDTVVWQEVCRLLEEPERLEQEYRQRLQPQEKPNEHEGLESQLGKLRRGIARLIDSYADGLIDKQEFEPRVMRMRERMQHLEEQLQRLKEESEVEEELRLILGRLEIFATQVNDGLRQADFQTRRDIIRALVKRVEVDEQLVRIIFCVSPTSPLSSSAGASHNWQDYGRRVLETHLQPVGRRIGTVGGQCSPYQGGSRKENGCARCGVDYGFVAAWLTHEQFYSSCSPTGVAGTDTVSDQSG